MRKTSTKILITLIVIAAFVLLCVLLSMRRVDTFEDKYAGVDLTTDVAGMERTGTYTGYLNAHADAATPAGSIPVDLEHFTADGDVHAVEDLEGEAHALYTETGSTVTFTVDVPEAGFYRLHTRYLLPESRGVAAERCVYINGEILNEKYGPEKMAYPGIAEQEITLGDDEYFVLGDNRNVSEDSTCPDVGLIKRKDIIGRAWLRI